jgi:integrase
MATYRPKNSTIFLYDFVLEGERHYGTTHCKTKRDADAFEAKKRAELALGKKAGKPLVTLDEAAGRYEDHLRANGKWSATMDYLIANVVEGLGGDRFLSDITEQDLRDHFAKRAGKVSAASVNREIEVARPIWRRHRRTHEIGEMPEWGEMFYAVAEQDPRELGRDEEERLFTHLRADLQDFARFALLSGWRLKEVRMLRWSDLSLVERSAKVRLKGGKIAARPLTEDMLVLIANQVKAGPFVFTYVCQKSRKEFVDIKRRLNPARLMGERYSFTQSGWRRPWAAALKAAGIDELRFHDLRHTRGTRILRHTGNLAIVQKALARSRLRCAMPMPRMRTFAGAWMFPSPELFPTRQTDRAKTRANLRRIEQCCQGVNEMLYQLS